MGTSRRSPDRGVFRYRCQRRCECRRGRQVHREKAIRDRAHSGGLSDADIERMVNEAEQMREADNKKKEGVTAKNDAETLCYQVEKQLSELKDKMSTADADDLKKKME